MPPRVSVIIPTVNRRLVIGRAVQSALGQSLKEIEVIVVVDGPDDDTQRALAPIQDSRLRTVVLESNQGPGFARNAGVEHARAEWVAFLDDDDEWFPRKLEIQLRAAEQSIYTCPIISCRLLMRDQTGELVLPHRVIQPGEPVSEYLFCRRGIFWGEGFLATSTLFAKSELLRRLPFKPMRRLEDIDWLLRASLQTGVGVEFVPTMEPLAIWDQRERAHSSRPGRNWRRLPAQLWIESNRHLFTPPAFASFILLWRSVSLARSCDPRIFFSQLREAFRYGKPRLRDLIVHVGIWLGLQRMRQRVESWFQRR